MAFFVGLTNNVGPVVENTDVVFDHIVTNVGNAYDPETGKFTAPADLMTQFSSDPVTDTSTASLR